MTDKTLDPFADLADLENPADFVVDGTEEVIAPDALNTASATNQISAGNSKSVTAEPGKYPCSRCKGTGQRVRYVVGAGWGQRGERSPCGICKGTGKLKTSPDARAKSRKNAAARKDKLAEQRRAEKLAAADNYRTANPDVAEWLDANKGRGSFAQSLDGGLNKYGSLTDGQTRAVRKIIAKNLAEEKTPVKVVKLTGVLGLLQNAKASGLKFPKLRLETTDGQKVVLSVAGNGAKRPGTINITDGGPFGENKWFGRISTDGILEASRACTDDVTALLNELNAGGGNFAKVQGQRTGNCCCCGRELTKTESINAGIGPICAGKWGF